MWGLSGPAGAPLVGRGGWQGLGRLARCIRHIPGLSRPRIAGLRC
jgi:hypothetical protein